MDILLLAWSMCMVNVSELFILLVFLRVIFSFIGFFPLFFALVDVGHHPPKLFDACAPSS